MKRQDGEQLTLFPADSPASRSLSPGSDAARMMTVTSGRRCFALFGNSLPLGCLVRMCLESSIWRSTRCYLTWKVKTTKSRRSLFRLAASTPRTSGSASALWPTPTTGASLCGGTGNLQQLRKLALEGRLTAEEVKNLSSGSGGKTNPALIEWLMGYERAFTQIIPTPTARDWKGAPTTRFFLGGGYRHMLPELVECTPLGRLGPMNPAYLEYVMGYPIGWTELSPSATPSSRNNSISSSN